MNEAANLIEKELMKWGYFRGKKLVGFWSKQDDAFGPMLLMKVHKINKKITIAQIDYFIRQHHSLTTTPHKPAHPVPHQPPHQ